MKRTLSIVVLFSILTALAAIAGPAITPIQPNALIQPLESGRPTATCIVGNTADPAWAVDWIEPPQKFALIIDPNEGCGECPLGFRIDTIHVALQFDGPCELTMEAILTTIEGDPYGGCVEPGIAYCGSQNLQIVIPEAGLWDVALPVSCACADPDFLYALKIEFESSCDDGSVPQLVTDDFPMGCRNYVHEAGEWTDLAAVYQFPGNLLFWGESTCCDNPVGAETSTWGDLKAIYR